MNRKQRRAMKGMKVGDVIFAERYRIIDSNSNSSGLFWFYRPDGMTREQAFETQQHYGPFASDAEVKESQRIVLLGEQCKVTEGGMWDPAWGKPQ
jgi:hypothetical protein